MNKIKSSFCLVLFLLVIGSFGAAQAKAADTPEQVATDFYKWYLHEIIQDKFPQLPNPKLSAVVSARLGRWLRSKAYKDWDADYFIDAQDFDKEWEDSISTSKAVISGNNASLDVTLGVFKDGRKYEGIGKHVLHLKMVKEGGAWKIDHIDNY